MPSLPNYVVLNYRGAADDGDLETFLNENVMPYLRIASVVPNGETFVVILEARD